MTDSTKTKTANDKGQTTMNRTKPKPIRINDRKRVYNWRTGNNFLVNATSRIEKDINHDEFHFDYIVWIVSDLKFPTVRTASHHYATWDPTERRWDDGDI